tara:strand:+ start:836 stop:976 length:141 start_codon:yes stop_codon:yes gene_type:complete
MHIITYTTSQGDNRRITFPASKIKDVIDFIKVLYDNRVKYHHIFED